MFSLDGLVHSYSLGIWAFSVGVAWHGFTFTYTFMHTQIPFGFFTHVMSGCFL